MSSDAKKSREGRGAAAERAFHEEAAFSQSYDLALLARLWPFLAPYKLPFFAAMAMMPLASELLVAQPRIMQRIIDEGVARRDLAAVERGALTLAGLVVAEQLLRVGLSYLLQVVGQRSMADLRRHVFRFLQRQRMAFFDRQPVGRLVTRVTNDIDAFGEVFASGAVTAVGDFVTLARIVVAMIAFSPRLSLWTFAAVPPLLVAVELIRRRARESFRAIRAKTARLNSYLNEQVTGVAVVQAYGKEARCQAEFDEINLAYKEANFDSIRYDAMIYAIVEAFASVCVAVMLFVGAQALGLGQPAASIGVMVAFVQYIHRFFEPLRDLSSKYTVMQSALSGAERVFSLLDQPEEDAPGEAGDAAPVPGAPAVEFRGVNFGYGGGRVALRDVSFAVPRGATTAFVGATGAGKTTVISLLQRLYEVDSGEVLLDGVDLRRIPREALSRRMVVVPQDVVLFPGDLLSNIALGDPKPDEARVQRLLEDLGLNRVLGGRGGGLHMEIRDRGANLSVGERQLVALARALYRDPELLVLDEATSSMDSESEAAVQAAIATALKGRTAIVIAHRLSTIREAQEILVFHRGAAVERGSHEALLRAGGFYARLHRLQFGEVAAAATTTAATG
ncbi:MAG: ABC transporter ATP-binding protein [Polyangiales bacterium]